MSDNDLIKTEAGGTSLSISVPQKDIQSELVSDEKVIGLYNEILDDIKEDSNSLKEVYEKFYDMIINEGDATSSSKEALVNLLKIKSEMADKKTKIMDLFVRIKLRDRDTFPKYLVANQKNTIVNSQQIDKKKLLEELKDES